MNVYIGGAKDYSAMQGPCDSGFHIPSKSEFDNIKTIRTGLGGGYNDGINFSLYLKLPPAGLRERTDAKAYYQGSSYGYWSSTANGNNSYFLYLSSSTIQTTGADVRSRGYPIRPFKDTSVVPDNSWTKLYGTSIEAGGIFHNSTLGLISLSSDGTNWVTISDKNLGATTVWNSGDTLAESNCGKYYQRGNNYGFAFTGTISSSTTLVNASSYGPGNYYSVATFIKVSNSPYDWSSVKNDNLRGGVTGIVSPAELKNAYIGEYVEEITETYTMSNISGGTRIWTSNLYKSGYKIIKIVQEGTITCTSSNEARQGIFNDTSQTLGMQSYYGFNAYRNAPEAIEKHYNNTWYRMQTLSSSYYSTTVNFRRETTATQIKTSYNGNTMTYDLTSEEVGWFKPILEGNSVYCTSQISNYGVSPLGTISTVTVTVTYEKI